jgi:hypothetical protein
MDCQSYVDQCQHLSYADEEPNHKTTLTCELALCQIGPLYCRVGGQCERRLCKDLLHHTSNLPSAPTPKCKDCFKPWIECIHDLCLSPTYDNYADRPAPLNCYKQDAAQCARYSWQDLKTAPRAFCIARSWANTPSHCHAGGCCAHTEYAELGIDFKSHPLTPSEQSRAMLSRGCNTFRDECLRTYDLGRLHNRCTKKCDKWYWKAVTKKHLCKDECEERTCWNECRNKTRCMGPEQCRVSGEVFRCGRVKLDCRTLEKGLEDSS